MRALRAAIAILLLGLVGCGHGKLPIMPSVVGQKLDVAQNDIKRAGFDENIDVVGGGVFGIIDEGNWVVCEQEPAAGQAIERNPHLKADRTCSDAGSTQAAPSSVPPAAGSSPVPSEPTITLANDADFAAASTSSDCGEPVTTFAAKYTGRTIEFDGSVGALNNHGSYKTRYDILILLGDNAKGTRGPNFQFRDVNLVSDLHFTGSVQDSMKVGDNLRITAAVDKHEPGSCLLLLKPVATQYR